MQKGACTVSGCLWVSRMEAELAGCKRLVCCKHPVVRELLGQREDIMQPKDGGPPWTKTQRVMCLFSVPARHPHLEPGLPFAPRASGGGDSCLLRVTLEPRSGPFLLGVTRPFPPPSPEPLVTFHSVTGSSRSWRGRQAASHTGTRMRVLAKRPRPRD